MLAVRARLVAVLAIAACSRSSEPAPDPAPPPAPAVAQPPPDAPAPDAAPASVYVVTAVPLKLGTASTVTFDADLDLDFNLGGLKTLTKTKQSKRKKVEIAAVDRDGTVYRRVTYLKRDTHIVQDGVVQPDPCAIRGKTYLVTFKDGKIDVKQRNGKPASEDEAEAVGKEENVLQSPEFLGRMLAGVRLVEGQPFEVPAAALAMLGTRPYHARRVALTYRGATADGARVDAEGDLADDDGGTKFYLEIRTRILLDDAAWVRRADITARVRVEYAGNVIGSGAGTAVITATPLR